MLDLLPSYILLLAYYYEANTAGWWPTAVQNLSCVPTATESLLIQRGVGAVRDQTPSVTAAN